MGCDPVHQVAGLYARIGGEQALRDFVARLYQYMDSLPEVQQVRDMHHLSLAEAGERLFRFLSGWLGGPPLYHRSYGEPRLRRRHMHISIGDSERDQWLLCARKALDDMHWPVAERAELLELLTDMADHLRNQGPSNIGCGAGCHPPSGL
jgi:hemoglobin